MQKLFEIKNVRVYDKINYDSIEIFSNQTSFIIGGSGTGKSTLLHLLNATISPESGEILYEKKPLEQWDTLELRREVLLVSQQIYLFDGTIEENFERFYKYRKTPLPSKEKFRYYLALCMADFPLDTLCAKLSGGERQRVYLAIFLSFQPKVLLLDEPTSALDDKTASELFENLIALRKEKENTIIVVSHDQQLKEQFAEEIIRIGRDEQ